MSLNENGSGTISLAQETKQVLQQYGIRLNRKLGQNYLIDDFKRKKILNFAVLSSDDVVLEIGPGIGTLTIPMAQQAKKVVAIEQDPRIARILKERVKEEELFNVEVMEADALKVDFPYFNKIVSNLPYQISSPITFKFLEYDFDLAVLMYQKEFAQRMNAPVGSKHYSRLSVMMHFKAQVKIVDNVSAQSFVPPPQVDSAVVKMIPLKNIETDVFFASVCRALFQHRRKKSSKSLRESFHEIGNFKKEEVKEILGELDSKMENNFLEERVFKLSPEKILEISTKLKELLNK
ncbi:MAG: 16S rRNA (adenine(1518)-N(6)/adenine(1519)-N(6))-dimethyltransferase RsmA [Methanobacteriaceae archaeon]|nr:16S rRNA (adenine(1518)-N(6)/adenine(1519)-N(6))-dimethyltransferase RsmA [Methanobacteriaceae archaeon]MDP2836154.1 16S rRNA (adenine(1518)-N(6)/adenine(1519)-N(6))-dimethyltransferase RsmA [Methanobacteriaceae archaeon]MDP3034278.1 16S rRNA (adenine(1518)-N(6)/adenine(1519)-N(6))-dimethyltransferase RsmA [Methanobacteriaceae archaeon]MDP3485994.1 16S rRNA (adenine(1518)-N(6)/adenine(1519)-N(6))-dimethyltransferase RsmA [Methanobacteriaceae archaeon]MDP3624356.1 16S rRNA (adenine(1518)-N(6)